MQDMVRAQRILLNEQFQVPELYASVGSSMGGRYFCDNFVIGLIGTRNAIIGHVCSIS